MSKNLATLLLFLSLSASGSVSAEPGGSETGSLKGRVNYVGQPPPRAPFLVNVNPEVCGAQNTILGEELVVGNDGGLANVALVLIDAPAAAPGARKGAATLDQKNCVFSPHVQTVTAGSELTIGNDDPVIHNVHALVEEETVFNLAMPLKGLKVHRNLDTPGLITVRCDSGHTWMRAYLLVLPHPFHSTSNKQGEFSISNVPPGKYTLRAWHEQLGVSDHEVQIDAGHETELKLSFDATTAGPTPVGFDVSTAKGAAPATLPAATAPAVPAAAAAAELAKSAHEAKLQRRALIRDRARPLYLRYCATCHGDQGDGKGETAPFCEEAPRDFRKGEYKFRSTPTGQLARIEDLYRTLTLGIPGTDMPPWSGQLNAEERRLLAEYVTTFSGRYLREDPPAPIEIPKEPPSDPGAISRGAALFQKLHCPQCHGPAGHGDGESKEMVDDLKRKVGTLDITRPRLKGGRGAITVFRAISTGLNGSPMPAFLDQTTAAERWDIAHYVESLGRSRGVFDYLFREGAGRRPGH